MRNWKLTAIQLGDQYKWLRSVDQIDRVAAAVFPFSRGSYPNDAITSERAKVVYGWIMTLSGQNLPEHEKERLLERFESAMHSIPLQPSAVQVLLALIHREIQLVAGPLFIDGYHADSVLAAMRHVNSRVKKMVKGKSGLELDGADLMHTAFSPKKPLIVLDDLATESGRNIQQGYMEIFAGAMMGIRNPKAHENITITAERALHFLILASLLMDKLDEAMGASFEELKRTYEEHNDKSARGLPSEKQCQCDKCKLHRSLVAV